MSRIHERLRVERRSGCTPAADGGVSGACALTFVARDRCACPCASGTVRAGRAPKMRWQRTLWLIALIPMCVCLSWCKHGGCQRSLWCFAGKGATRTSFLLEFGKLGEDTLLEFGGLGDVHDCSRRIYFLRNCKSLALQDAYLRRRLSLKGQKCIVQISRAERRVQGEKKCKPLREA